MLLDRLPKESSLAKELIEVLRLYSKHRHREQLAPFVSSLSPINREIYQQAQKIPYAEKDWWRDYHDLIVVTSIARICREENLPDWLITAAILHDRGYALLAALGGTDSQNYIRAGAVHWEAADTRVLHAKLSRDFARWLLFGGDSQSFDTVLTSATPNAVPFHLASSEREEFLSVIETHDFALIGRYQEMSLNARHHFDADSLFSISVVSFLKDYLAYLQDKEKRVRAQQLGILDNGEFTVKSLLAVRMARYFSTASELPGGWDLASYPLKPQAVKLNPFGICIRPHSVVGLRLIQERFLRLAQCCEVLERVDDVEQIFEWLSVEINYFGRVGAVYSFGSSVLWR